MATWEDSVPDPAKETEYYWTIDNLGAEGGYESDYFSPDYFVTRGCKADLLKCIDAVLQESSAGQQHLIAKSIP